MLPFGSQFGIEYHFAAYPRTPPAPLRGPLPLKGAQDVTGLLSRCLSPAKHSAEWATSGGHPLSGCAGLLPIQGQNKPLYAFLQRHVAHWQAPIVPPAKLGGKVVAQPPKGAAFPSPARAVVKVLS